MKSCSDRRCVLLPHKLSTSSRLFGHGITRFSLKLNSKSCVFSEVGAVETLPQGWPQFFPLLSRLLTYKDCLIVVNYIFMLKLQQFWMYKQ